MEPPREIPWEVVRQQAFLHYGRYCQDCGATDDLGVHHLHYDTWGYESVEDVVPLCWDCHRTRHQQNPSLSNNSPRRQKQTTPEKPESDDDPVANDFSWLDSIKTTCPECSREVSDDQVICGYCFNTLP